jgi:hypothetical protein
VGLCESGRLALGAVVGVNRGRIVGWLVGDWGIVWLGGVVSCLAGIFLAVKDDGGTVGWGGILSMGLR